MMLPVLSSPWQTINSTPPAAKCFTAGTVVLSLIYLWIRSTDDREYTAPYLVVIPGASLFFPWTFLTSVLIETSIFELLFSLIFVPAGIRYFERLWGTPETVKFIVIVTTISNLVSFALNWIEYVLFKNADMFLYGMKYYGQTALQAGLLVAATQVIAEHRVQLFGVLSVRVKRLPMAYVAFSNVMVLLGYQAPWINVQWGWLTAWAYLRFYKRNRGDAVLSESYGDRSDAFAFIHWFPPFVHRPLSVISDTVYNIFSRLHLLPGAGTDIESGNYSTVPGGARAEAERRRALALKALDQRLASVAAPPPIHISNSDNAHAPSHPSKTSDRPLSLENEAELPSSANAKRSNDKLSSISESGAESDSVAAGNGESDVTR